MNTSRMNTSRTNTALIVVTASLLLGPAVAWTIGVAVEPRLWPVRLATALGGALAAGTILALWGRRERAKRDATLRHFRALCELDPWTLEAAIQDGHIPPLPSASPWADLADQIRQTLSYHGESVLGLEHARTASDIRCRRAIDEAARIRAILAGLSDPVIAIDNFGELTLANPAAEELFNFDSESVEDRAIGQVLQCQKLVDLLTDTCRRKSTGHRYDEIEVARDQEESLWYRARASKLIPFEGEENEEEATNQGVVAVLRDIRGQKELQKRNAEFVSSVSHEMKTPLAGIKAYVELLVDGDAEDEETREEFLDVINGQADRLQRLVDNMLNLARIEAGVVSVNKQSRSLNEMLEETLQVVQPAAEAKRIELTSELSSLYLGVHADRDMLMQSAINLLSNAIKYTPDAGRVTIRSRLEDGRVCFEVEDTGVGLSQEDSQRVFDKFYRVQKDKAMASGTGLGLPLAKHIVEDVHGGRLTLESTLGVGSTFCVTLPHAGHTSS